MLLRCTFRLYPDEGQRVALARLFGCVRVVWNDALERVAPVKMSNKLLRRPRTRILEGPYQRVPRSSDLSADVLTKAKRTSERAWLKDVASVPLQQVLRDLDRAWKAHESFMSGRRPGPKVGAPGFKSRRDRRQSARFTRNAGWKITSAGSCCCPRSGL